MVYKPTTRDFMPERSADECLRLWGTVTVRARGTTHQQFADRISHQAVRPDWEPSPLQLEFMRKLVDLYAYDDIALDPELIALLQVERGQ